MKYVNFSGILANISCLVLLFTSVTGNDHQTNEADLYKIDYLHGKFPIFKSFKEVKERLLLEKPEHPGLTLRLLDLYYKSFTNFQGYERPKEERSRTPFIVVEVMDRYLSNSILYDLKTILEGETVHMPPENLTQILRLIKKGSPMKNIFFNLCVYAVADRVKQYLRSGIPVILTSYWTLQAAFTIDMNFQDLPPRNHSVYDFPTDLLAPDIIIHVHHKYKDEKPWSKGVRYLNIYEQFRNPSVDIVHFQGGFKGLYKNILNLIKTKVGFAIDDQKIYEKLKKIHN